MQKIIDAEAARDHQQPYKLQPWDWAYYAEALRKARYDFDEAQVAPYFELDRVLNDGVFFAAHELYGLTFKERKDLPVYQPDVRVFEVSRTVDTARRSLYSSADGFARDNKQGGAWMSSFVRQSRLFGLKPVVTNNLNIPKPQPGRPALLTFDEVTTLFHEFGHAIHGMLSNVHYPLLSGTAVPRDFVEYPSQYNEMWAREPVVLANFAKHYQTGAAMPQELLDMRSYWRRSSIRVMPRRSISPPPCSTRNGISSTPRRLRPPPMWPPSRLPRFAKTASTSRMCRRAITRSTFCTFSPAVIPPGTTRICGAKCKARDTGQWMHDHGGLTRANGDYLRDKVLSRGRSQDPQTQFRNFYGRDPDIGPLIEYRGLAAGH